MSTTPTFGAAVLGQTEKALNAILDRHLAGTGLTERQWIALTLTVVGGGAVDRRELVGRLAGGLKISDAAAEAEIDQLTSAQLLEPVDGASTLKMTDAGQELHARIRTTVSQTTEQMWGDLPAEDLETTGRVLSTILARANEELAAA
jgi:DNA-binding MarR family transcriptional regulator